jgi:hypothetical protein
MIMAEPIKNEKQKHDLARPGPMPKTNSAVWRITHAGEEEWTAYDLAYDRAMKGLDYEDEDEDD